MAQLLDQFTDQLNAGQQPDVDGWLAQHPELASTLRPVLEALQSVHDMSLSGASPLVMSRDGETNGKRLGDFHILREIGRGGMGVVYEAEQLSMGRTVALKVLPFAAVMDEKAITRFKNEARAAGTLHHPNIVPVHSVGNERGVYYYAMALIEGLTLADVIQELHDQVVRGGAADSRRIRLEDVIAGQSNSTHRVIEQRFTPVDATLGHAINDQSPQRNARAAQTAREVRAAISTRRSSFDQGFFQQVARIGIQASEALHHAHEHGIVHRDIKPGNLMIDATGKLWVTDFGLARIATDPCMTMTGDLVGTLRYMAPEQALANRIVVDHRADIYSLGVTLYELLTFQPVFDGASRETLLKQLTFDEPTPPRQINPYVPTDLATIVCKAMSKNPDDRYSSAQRMADDLHAFLDERPIAAKPPSLPQRATKWARRHRLLIRSALVVAATAVIGLAVSVGLVTAAYQREFEQRRRAEANATEAERQSKLAKAQSRLAETQRALAEEQRTLYEEQRQEAELQAQKAEALLLIAVRDLSPMGAAFGPDGNFYVGGRGVNAVLRYDGRTGNFLSVFVPPGEGGLVRPEALTFGPDGNGDGRADLYVAGNQSILRYCGSTGAFLDPVVAFNEGGLGQTTGLTFGPDHNLYVADFSYSRIMRYSAGGEFIDTFVPPGSGGLQRPQSVRFGPDQHLYVTSHHSHSVLRYDGSTGRFLGAFVAPRAGGLTSPEDAAFGPDGALYVLSKSDDLASSVLRYDGRTGAFLGELIPAGNGGLMAAQTLVFGPTGDVYVTSSHTDTVSRFELATGRFHGFFATYRRENLFRALDNSSMRQPSAVSLAEVSARLRSGEDAVALTHRKRIERFFQAGDYEKAEAEFVRAEANSNSHPHLYKQRALGQFHLGNYGEALKHLAKAVELNPGDGSNITSIQPADVAKCPDHHFRARLLELADRAVQMSGGSAQCIAARALLYDAFGRVEEAGIDLREAVRLAPDDTLLAYYLTLHQLAGGHQDAYRQACAEMLSKFGNTKNAEAARWVTWSSVLGVGALDDYTPAIELARRFIKHHTTQCLGGLLFRAGRFEEAVSELAAVAEVGEESGSSIAYTYYLLAMAQWRLDQYDHAREWLDRANVAADAELKEVDHVPWNRRQTLQLFRRETEAMIAAAPSK